MQGFTVCLLWQDVNPALIAYRKELVTLNGLRIGLLRINLEKIFVIIEYKNNLSES